MTKHVFNAEMVYHVWAQNTQSHGRRSDDRVFFDEGVIYSYGRHFVIGKILPTGEVLLNASKYSVSTSRHCSDAADAVRHRKSYRVPNLTALVNRVRWSRLATDSGERVSLLSFVREHFADMTPETAKLLLRHCGIRPSRIVATIEKFSRDVARAKAKKERDVAKSALDLAARSAKTIAKRQAVDVREYMAKQNGPDAERRAYLCARRHVLAAIKAGRLGVRQVAAAKANLRIMKESVANRVYRDGRARDLRLWQSHKATVRNALKWFHPDTFNKPVSTLDAPDVYETAERMREDLVQGCVSLRHLHDMSEATKRTVNRAALSGMSILLSAAGQSVTRALGDAREKRDARLLAEWRETGDGRCPNRALPDGSAYLAARGVVRDAAGVITAGELVTSQGATVPLLHAIRAFQFLKLCHDTGREWQANGHSLKVGHFQITRVTPSHFVAGCHLIGWPEVEALATRLGVLNVEATDSVLSHS